MRPKSSALLFAIVTSSLMLLLATMVGAHEDTQAGKPATENSKPSIEFKDKMVIGKGDNDQAEASYTVTIKLLGLEQEAKFKFEFQGRYATPNASVLALETQLGGGPNPPPPQWKYTRDDKKLVIEGWTDPKTMKFYPVAEIKFESAHFRKEYWPTIKLPPKP